MYRCIYSSECASNDRSDLLYSEARATAKADSLPRTLIVEIPLLKRKGMT